MSRLMELAAFRDIAAERERQVAVEGWTPEHDDAHSHGEIARAAACYAAGSINLEQTNGSEAERGWHVAKVWPWHREWWKPSDRRRNLVKAGALIVAEIERLDRARAQSANLGGGDE